MPQTVQRECEKKIEPVCETSSRAGNSELFVLFQLVDELYKERAGEAEVILKVFVVHQGHAAEPQVLNARDYPPSLRPLHDNEHRGVTIVAAATRKSAPSASSSSSESMETG